MNATYHAHQGFVELQGANFIQRRAAAAEVLLRMQQQAADFFSSHVHCLVSEQQSERPSEDLWPPTTGLVFAPDMPLAAAPPGSPTGTAVAAPAAAAPPPAAATPHSAAKLCKQLQPTDLEHLAVQLQQHSPKGATAAGPTAAALASRFVCTDMELAAAQGEGAPIAA